MKGEVSEVDKSYTERLWNAGVTALVADDTNGSLIPKSFLSVVISFINVFFYIFRLPPDKEFEKDAYNAKSKQSRNITDYCWDFCWRLNHQNWSSVRFVMACPKWIFFWHSWLYNNTSVWSLGTWMCLPSHQITTSISNFWIEHVILQRMFWLFYRIGVLFVANGSPDSDGRLDAGVGVVRAFSFIKGEKSPKEAFDFVVEVCIVTKFHKLSIELVFKISLVQIVLSRVE